jgi:hypothetical protein
LHGSLANKQLALKVTFVRTSTQKSPYNEGMHLAEELHSGTTKRLEKQGRYLLRTYQADFAKDPTSHATESSRSNLMAVQHTVTQMYGDAVARDVANLFVRTE